MPKYNFYEDIKTIKKPFKYKLKILLKIIVFLLIFGVCFFSATQLSRAITIGNIGNFMVYGGTKIEIPKTSLYAVVLGEYDSKEKATQVGVGATIQGASGYVWHDKNYWVIGNIYSTENDALKVIENLKDSNYKIAIKEIIFDKVLLNFEEFDNKDVSEIREAYDFFNKVYKELYEYSNKYDKKELNNLTISSYVSKLRGENKIYITFIQKLLEKPNNQLNFLQDALIRLDELLDQTILKTIDNRATVYQLKNSIAECVRIKYDMHLKLS